LLKQFKNRHGIKFNEKLLDRVKKYFSWYPELEFF
jgi:hypothetical protein